MLVPIFASVAVLFLGSLLHFTYAWSKQNKFLAIFSAVNESTWEHIKIALVPTLIFCVFSPLFYPDASLSSLCVASAVCLLSIVALIPLLFYPISALMKRHSVPVTIVEFFLTALASQFIFYLLKTQSFPQIFVIISLVAIFTIVVLIPVFTFSPPRLGLFKDPRNQKYGLTAFSAHHHHNHSKQKSHHDKRSKQKSRR